VGEERSQRKAGWSTDVQSIVGRIFVYASLREGQAERSMIAEHIGGSVPAVMSGRIYQLAEGLVGCVDAADETMVGEVLELTDLAAAIPLLDNFQGEEFVRVLKPARLTDGSEVWAWVYMLADPERIAGATPIPGGDYLAWSAGRAAGD
jgi:gamma-glutamylcyclotransferase (GGCT)/AIG2-like uncharacterized protein YtfP